MPQVRAASDEPTKPVDSPATEAFLFITTAPVDSHVVWSTCTDTRIRTLLLDIATHAVYYYYSSTDFFLLNTKFLFRFIL